MWLLNALVTVGRLIVVALSYLGQVIP